jgi:type I restriction enzyme S subunit
MSEWKETEIGKIPSNWNITTVAEVIQDKGLSVGVMYPGDDVAGGIPLIRVADIKEGKINRIAGYHISPSVNETHKRTILNGGEVIVTLVGNPGATVVVTDEFKGWNVARAIGVMKLIDPSDGRFISYTLNSPYSKFQIDSFLNTTVQPTLNLGELKLVQIPWPDKSIRSSIAEVLSSLDDKIDLLHRNNKTLELMAETLFRQWFLVEAKEEWEEKKVSDIIEIRDGTHDSPKQAENGRYLVTSKNLRPNEIDFTSAYKISEADYHLINKRSVVEEGDILISMIGTLGLLHLVVEKPDYAIKNIGLFKSSQKPWFSRFLLLLLKSPVGKNYIYENADGSTQEYISLGSLRKFSFNYPGEERIRAFDNQVEPLLNKVKHNSAQIRTLSKTRDSLLPKLMSGMVRVKTN